MRFQPLFLFAAAAVAHPFHGATEGGPHVPAYCSSLPSNLTLVNQTYVLPDPFHFLDGKPVTSRQDWFCRAAQVKELFQKYELGFKPPKPPVFSSSFAGNILTITAGTSKNNTITFSVPISAAPANSTGKRPAILAYGGASIPIPSNVVTINLNVDAIAQQNSAPASRGVGLFYQLYPNATDTAGALMAWA